MKSWNGSVNGVVAATARSTCSSPSTSRRTVMPRRARAASSIGSSMAIPQFLVCVERPANEGIGGAQVAGRLERSLDLLRGDAGRGKPLLELGHGQQYILQWQSRADGPRARLRHQVVRLGAAEHAGQQRGHV